MFFNIRPQSCCKETDVKQDCPDSRCIGNLIFLFKKKKSSQRYSSNIKAIKDKLSPDTAVYILGSMRAALKVRLQGPTHF